MEIFMVPQGGPSQSPQTPEALGKLSKFYLLVN